MVTFEGVYQKKYLNILECSFLLNLGLLSALAAVYQNDNNSEQIVTIISNKCSSRDIYWSYVLTYTSSFSSQLYRVL